MNILNWLVILWIGCWIGEMSEQGHYWAKTLYVLIILAVIVVCNTKLLFFIMGML